MKDSEDGYVGRRRGSGGGGGKRKKKRRKGEGEEEEEEEEVAAAATEDGKSETNSALLCPHKSERRHQDMTKEREANCEKPRESHSKQ